MTSQPKVVGGKRVSAGNMTPRAAAASKITSIKHEAPQKEFVLHVYFIKAIPAAAVSQDTAAFSALFNRL